MSRVDAPWTAEQVEHLTERQASNLIHQYTCPDCATPLVPMLEGWWCPAQQELMQWWAHDFDLNGEFLKAVTANRKGMK